MLTIPSRHLARRKVEINVGTRGNMDLRFSLSYTDTFISMPFTVIGFILSYLQLKTNMIYLSVGVVYAGYLLDLPGQYLLPCLRSSLGTIWVPVQFGQKGSLAEIREKEETRAGVHVPLTSSLTNCLLLALFLTKGRCFSQRSLF